MIILILLLLYLLYNSYNIKEEGYDEYPNAYVSGRLISGTVYASNEINPGIGWVL
jgi:hypothetical protein